MFSSELLLLAKETVSRLSSHGFTIATAESCTGGLIAALLTEISGASRVFRYGWITYANAAKIRELSVPADLIGLHTVVSEPVVKAMAASAQKKSKADFALAVSGNAGPSAPENEPPVGTVCIALATPEGISSYKLFLPDLSRRDFRLAVVRRSLQLLLDEI